MNRVLNAAAVAVAMGFCAPAFSGAYEECCQSCRDQAAARISAECGGQSGASRQKCEARINETRINCDGRCLAADQIRIEQIAARARETAARDAARAAEAAARAKARGVPQQ